MSEVVIDRAGRLLAALALVLAATFCWTATSNAAAPANDAFAGATTLPGTFHDFGPGSTVEATKEGGEPNHAESLATHTVWYSWTPTENGPVGVKARSCLGGQFEPVVAVYTGSAVNALTPVADNGPWFSSDCFFSEPGLAEFEAMAGITYRIAVAGAEETSGSFELEIEGAPANDGFANAKDVEPQLPQTVTSANRIASKEPEEPDHAGDPGGHSVWFEWTPTASEPVDVSTCARSSRLDAVLAVYTGSSLGSLAEVASNDDGPEAESNFECLGNDSVVSFEAEAGTTYRIAVDGAGETVGRFNLRIRGRPENDDFASPQALPPSIQVFTNKLTNKGATKEPEEPEHAGDPGSHSVWFEWTPPAAGRYVISTECGDGNLDSLLAVYTGSSLGGLTEVASNDDSPSACKSTASQLEFEATASTPYRIAVDGKAGSTGSFALKIDPAPENDAFAAADVLSPELPTDNLNWTRGASKQAGEPEHAGDPGGHSVWYSWTPVASGPVTISTCPLTDSGPDTLLAVYTGSSIGGLTEVASNDDSPRSCRYFGSEVAIEAEAGTTYRIVVDSKEGARQGHFMLELSGPPANDAFSAARDLPVSSGSGTTAFATGESEEPEHAGRPAAHSVWFEWTAQTSRTVLAKACGAGVEVDTLLAVYTGASLGSLTPVAAADDTGTTDPGERCGLPSDSEVEFEAEAGTTYRIAVDSKESEGQFSIAIEGARSNDDFASRERLIGSFPLFAAPPLQLATSEPEEPEHAGQPAAHSIWYWWKAPKNESVAFYTCTRSGDVDSLLSVYSGSALGSLTEVAGNDDTPTVVSHCRSTDSMVEFSAVAGTVYQIAVDSKGGTAGGLQLIGQSVSANDEFGKAQPLGGEGSAQWFGSSRFATRQVEEPEHAGDPGGHSLWFKWTAPRSGEFSLETCDSGFDTLLAVYTGSSLGSLTEVAGNDDGGGACSPQSRLTFEAVANSVYRIAVDGGGGAQGPLWLRLDSPPENDEFEAAETIPGSTGWWLPGSIQLATKQSGEPEHEGDPGGHSVWYSWTPAKGAEVEIDVCSGGFDPLVGVYTGSAVGALTPVATGEGSSPDCDEGHGAVFEAHYGVNYRIAIDGAGGDAGHFEMHLRGVVPILHELTLAAAGGGSGAVLANRGGFDCESTCSQRFQEGLWVTLEADPDPGSTFTGWSGGGCSGTGSCLVALTDDLDVTAQFASTSPGGGGGAGETPSTAPSGPGMPAAVTAPVKKPFKCKRGFKKKLVHGKRRCVKPRHRRGKHRGHR
jgi:Divergent InlB B-repeat domain